MNAYIPLIARILLSAIFIMGGVMKLTGLEGTAGYIEATVPWMPLPMFAALVAGLIELVAGTLILVGFHTRCAAWTMVIFLVPVTLLFHPPTDPQQITQFLKNAAIIGGFLLLTQHGAGAISCDNKKESTPGAV